MFQPRQSAQLGLGVAAGDLYEDRDEVTVLCYKRNKLMYTREHYEAQTKNERK